MKVVLYKVVPFINPHILSQIPAFYDFPSQSYNYIQLVPNYPIISISAKSKGLTEKLSSAKLFLSSKYTFWVQSQLSMTFIAKVTLLPN